MATRRELGILRRIIREAVNTRRRPVREGWFDATPREPAERPRRPDQRLIDYVSKYAIGERSPEAQEALIKFIRDNWARANARNVAAGGSVDQWGSDPEVKFEHNGQWMQFNESGGEDEGEWYQLVDGVYVKDTFHPGQPHFEHEF